MSTNFSIRGLTLSFLLKEIAEKDEYSSVNKGSSQKSFREDRTESQRKIATKATNEEV